MTMRKTVSAAKRRAIRALISSITIEEAAEKAKIKEMTLWRWLGHDADFQEALNAERHVQRLATCLSAEALLGEGVDTLERVLNDENTSDRVKVQAARAIFEIAIELYKLTSLEERITAVEQRAKARRESERVGELEVVPAAEKRLA